MPTRRKQPAQTRLAILGAAAAEFASNGYASSGIGAIVARGGITKGALFHHFPDKRALALAWINETLEPDIHETWVAPLETITSLDTLRNFCRARCLDLTPGDTTASLVSLSSGEAASEPILASAVASSFSSWRAALVDLLERGKSSGWIHPSIQPTAEATFLISAFCGFSTMSHCFKDENTLRNCATSVLAYLDTLRPQ